MTEMMMMMMMMMIIIIIIIIIINCTARIILFKTDTFILETPFRNTQ